MEHLNTNHLLSEIQFSESFFKLLNQKNEDISLVSIENLAIKTIDNQGQEYIHNLENAYSEYCSEPKEYEEIVERYSEASETIYFQSGEINRDRIVPIIKDERFFLESSKSILDFENYHLFEKYNSNLYIFYAQDLEHTISYLQKDDLKTLNLDFDELRDLAIGNLSSIIENIERHGEQSIFMLTADGNYEASLLLLNIWNHENFNVNGDIIIAIPARDLLFITGTNEENGIKELKNKVKDINETGDHIVSDKLFILNNKNHFDVWE